MEPMCLNPAMPFHDQWKVVITLRVEDAEDAENTQVNWAGGENPPGKPKKHRKTDRLMSTMIFLHVKVVTDWNIP